MNKKNKFLYYFLIIITFGIILFFWRKQKVQKKNYLTIDTKISINVEKVKNLLGSKENIEKIESSQNKIKFFVKKIDLVQVKELENCKGVSGIFLTSKTVQLIVGKSAQTIKDIFQKNSFKKTKEYYG